MRAFAVGSDCKTGCGAEMRLTRRNLDTFDISRSVATVEPMVVTAMWRIQVVMNGDGGPKSAIKLLLPVAEWKANLRETRTLWRSSFKKPHEHCTSGWSIALPVENSSSIGHN
jgi:hypothetical protein